MEDSMTEEEIRKRAFAMPLTSPAFPPGPYRFIDREYLIITYRTDPERLRAIVPEPLALEAPLVKYEFIRMPDSTGFGDYTESGQVIPVSLNGRRGSYTHCMFLDDESPIAGGRELWGFPKKLASPCLKIEKDMLVGTLDYGPVRVATGTMGYKHRTLDASQIKLAMSAPNFLIKVIPHVDGSPRICELVAYQLEDVEVRGAWAALARCSLIPTRWRLSPTCRCLSSSRPPTSLQI
jgi:acetoacetate decarboxylase